MKSRVFGWHHSGPLTRILWDSDQKYGEERGAKKPTEEASWEPGVCVFTARLRAGVRGDWVLSRACVTLSVTEDLVAKSKAFVPSILTI